MRLFPLLQPRLRMLCLAVSLMTISSSLLIAGSISVNVNTTSDGLNFPGIVVGPAGGSANVAGSLLNSGGSITVGEEIGDPYLFLNIALDLIIGPQSIGNAATTNWSFRLYDLTPNIPVSFGPVTLSSSALTYVPSDPNSGVPVAVSAYWYYTIGNDSGLLSSARVDIGSGTVWVTANQDFVPPPPEPAEPATIMFIPLGLLMLGVYRHRSLHGTFVFFNKTSKLVAPK